MAVPETLSIINFFSLWIPEMWSGQYRRSGATPGFYTKSDLR